MKGKLGVLVAGVVLAASISATGVAEAKRSPEKSALTGCRMMAVAVHDSAVPDPYTVGAAIGLYFRHARRAYRPTSADEASVAAVYAWIARVGASCEADFPNDPVVQRAQYPTN